MRYQIEPIDGWPFESTNSRKGDPFQAPWKNTLNLLDRELTALRVTEAVAIRIVTTDAEQHLGGMPRDDAHLTHPGVVLSFQSKHGPLSYSCDTFDGHGSSSQGWQINVRAIALTLEALRKVNRYGVTCHRDRCPRQTLSPRELQVMACVAQGMTNSKIAADLGVGTETVRSHVKNALVKLEARDRAHATALCYQHGILGGQS